MGSASIDALGSDDGVTVARVLVLRARGCSVGFGLLAAWLLGSACGSPSASTVPLGLGPLAVAERDRDVEAALHRSRPATRNARARSEPTASPKTAPPSAAAAGDEADEDDEAEAPEAKAGSGGPLEGLYAGEDIAIYRLTGYPDREERDDKAQIRIEAASGGNVGITLINSADGSDLCELIARVEGNAALIEAAQPCFSDGSEGSIQAELTSGRAVVVGDRLKMDAEGTLSVPLPDQELDGQLSYSFQGQRQ